MKAQARPPLDRSAWLIPVLWIALIGLGLMLDAIEVAAATALTDTSFHDTYLVVSPMHFVLTFGVACLVFAGVYALLGPVLRTAYRRPLGWAHLALPGWEFC